MTVERMSPLMERLLVGSGSFLLVLISIFFSTSQYFHPIFVVLTGALIGTAVWEYCQMAFHKGYAPLTGLSVISTVVYVFAVFLSTKYSIAHSLPEIVLIVTMAAIFIYYFSTGREPLVNTALSLFPIAYLALPLSCIIRINYFDFPAHLSQDGRLWLLYAVMVTKMTDVGGYFVGKKWGHTLLSPMISPNKTREGAFGGLVCAILTSYVFSYLIGFSWITAVILGVIISVLAQFGDLAESLLKRDTGVKDSSHLPGLGGSLDIVDSLVFTLPFVYIFLLVTTSSL